MNTVFLKRTIASPNRRRPRGAQDHLRTDDQGGYLLRSDHFNPAKDGLRETGEWDGPGRR